ncbi:MAG: tRNA (N(6)-L-threonylcarbamoyladenosine(37)-C(2))-methylthiotransferase MtaB [Clostridiales bacterium]|jgi:threonylcarbamoyladenosine tRNA methylthiotransferase MtaB|nr:tRNA (N(6)-L-threonylcarbamoyladenosine(37)-C(2))-methylthiotransferase MtaB [Clostridiales bacterium]
MPAQNKTVAAYTLGCKVNLYDTEAMLALFRKSGYTVTDFESFADVYIVNTCTVTNLGDKKSRQMIRRAGRTNPAAIIAAVGCYAQVAPEEVAKIEGVNLVLGTAERGKIVELVEQAAEHAVFETVKDVQKETVFEALSVSQLSDRRRAFLKIQDGCDRYCTYCIIPYARGRVRSRNPADILREVGEMARNGYKEIVLAGIHVASYGRDLDKIELMDIIEQVHAIDGIERIRTSSVDPSAVDGRLIERLKKLPKVCDHFHLSLQSGAERILKRMNRRYTAAEYRAVVEALRAAFPDVALTTDVIVGFPGETDEDFRESYDFIEEAALSQLHVFPYSPKKGTPAAAYENQIAQEIKNERSAQMLALSKKLNDRFLNRFIGREVRVLYERTREPGIYEGHSTNYIPVQTVCARDIENRILDARIEKIENGTAISATIE